MNPREVEERMGEFCDLRAANGQNGWLCEGEECAFWRLVEHVGDESGTGCAIKHFQLLGDEQRAAWLLSVKERIEAVERKK